MGHTDIAVTRKYIHYSPQPGAAARLGALVGEQSAEVAELYERDLVVVTADALKAGDSCEPALLTRR